MFYCEKCGTEHDGTLGSGRFCSRSCANSHIPSPEHRQKTSKSLVGKKTMRKNKVKWIESITLAHKRKNDKRKIDSLVLPFDQLSNNEKRYRILEEQNRCCAWCNIPQEWNGKPLKFDFDHISGIRSDESRENLRLLCPNCHSQTPTYKSKNYVRDRISDDIFCKALVDNDSIYKALVALGVNRSGGNYRRSRNLIKQYNLPTRI